MRGVWKKRTVEYVPGRIIVGLHKNKSNAKALELIESCGGTVEHIDRDIVDVRVPVGKTLEIASLLAEKQELRFVSPEILEKERKF